MHVTTASRPRATRARRSTRPSGDDRELAILATLEGLLEHRALADISVDDLAKGAEFLTVAEVASLMRVSKMTVYRLVHNGELPAVRVGRSFRVHAKAVHDMLESSYFDAG